MKYNQEKLVRFQDWVPQKSVDAQFYIQDDARFGKFRRLRSSISDSFNRGCKCLPQCFGTIGKYFSGSFLHESWSKKKVLDPQGAFLQKWNKIFILSCVIAVSIDPLFFYIPVINNDKKCLHLDHKLEVIASVLRSFTDIFYVLHIVFQFRTGFIAPSSRVFGRGVLVEDGKEIAKRYMSSYFWIDIFAVLPLPQVAILIIIPKLRGSRSLNTKNLLKFLVVFQYIPRIARVFPLYKEVTRTSGILTETAWAGAAFNLLLYMLASHVVGAFWYLFSIERETTCWRKACAMRTPCDLGALYCDLNQGPVNNAYLNESCPITSDNTGPFDFGMFMNALTSGVVETTDFPKKFLFCFWWGLQNLSSLGQNLQTSTYVWENLFAILIAIAGLVLFAFLIGNMQTYLQSITTRLEEMRVKKRDAEQWMSHRLLPLDLRDRIRRYEQYKWQETRGVDEESLIKNLPKDLRRDIKRHLCLDLVTRVPMFEKMDGQLLDAMCDCLKPVLYTQSSCVIREGDPVDSMVFVMRGRLRSMTTNGGRTGFFNCEYLKAGDFCGEELLTWALDPNPSSNLPLSTRTVETQTEVEAFALLADDLKFVASQFRRLHSKQLRHTFRHYSQQWRTWAACFIQAAWRRYHRKKMEQSLKEEEDRLQDALAREAGCSSPSLGATIYASRFAANALRALRRNGARKARLPERISPILLQKPAEPDFSVEHQ
ncbi:cyclic nucleotide-gated ion channel 1 [Amaranthus tricolor]|uniref:cyclic nucleotide-gated ion channel 1 n=1 Tax=Amaranthus tricolor TaxID=29722 RepID=UPI00258DD0A6|nr:cyclic nucleotide-gated ion channel 1 [Amaranthus tricolor]XP_057546478.1 cyclic nucleotide-gated ion channel 1 [Amaranthus tricolor]XP_057546479.1 cyclic nucleotide-gated ion channel 1 [Amaranthus tricolor]